MTTPRNVRVRLTVVLGICLLTHIAGDTAWGSAGGTILRPGGDTLLVHKGVMAPGARPEVRRLELDTAANGWDIVLDMTDPEALDLDLFVYGQAPDSSAAPMGALCRSEGVGRREWCRLSPRSRGPVWIVVEARSGESPTSLLVRAWPVTGTVLQGTNLVASDATPIDPRDPVRAAFGPADAGVGGARGRHLYALDAAAAGVLVLVASSVPVFVSAYDSAGVVIASTDAGAGQDIRIDRPGSHWFLLVRLARVEDGLRGASYTLTLAPQGGALPVVFTQADVPRDFRARGTEDREYALTLDAGQTAIVELDGWATLTVADRDSAVPVMSSPSPARQRALIGVPVGTSRYVLRGQATDRTVRIRVTVRPDTIARTKTRVGSRKYQRSSERALPLAPPVWALRVVVDRRYVVRFSTQEATPWVVTGAASTKVGTIPAGKISVIWVSAPTTVTPIGGMSAAQTAWVPPSQQFLARLDAAAAKHFDLAVCTEDGQALDMEDAAVRWPSGEAGVYLVVVPDSLRPPRAERRYRLDLTRSAFVGGFEKK